MVWGISRDLSYAFIELLTNTVHALQGQELASIQVRSDVEPSTFEGMKWICLEIEDNGPGIQEKVGIDHIFDLFVTSKDDGSGLGLAIVRQTIEEHHKGSMTISPGPRAGVRVTVRLPISRIVIPGAA